MLLHRSLRLCSFFSACFLSVVQIEWILFVFVLKSMDSVLSSPLFYWAHPVNFYFCYSISQLYNILFYISYLFAENFYFLICFNRIYNGLLKHFYDFYAFKSLSGTSNISFFSGCWHQLMGFCHSSCGFPGSWSDGWFPIVSILPGHMRIFWVSFKSCISAGSHPV